LFDLSGAGVCGLLAGGLSAAVVTGLLAGGLSAADVTGGEAELLFDADEGEDGVAAFCGVAVGEGVCTRTSYLYEEKSKTRRRKPCPVPARIEAVAPLNPRVQVTKTRHGVGAIQIAAEGLCPRGKKPNRYLQKCKIRSGGLGGVGNRQDRGKPGA
jgi:hypothetical protein